MAIVKIHRHTFFNTKCIQMLWNMVKEYGCRDSCKSNYHTITTTKAPTFGWIIFYGVITYCPLWPKKFSLVDFIVVAGGLDYIFILFLKVVWYCAIFCLSICFISNNIWSIYDTTLCDSLSVTSGRWFFQGILVSFTKNNSCHDITEILLKVVLNTITLTSSNQKVN